MLQIKSTANTAGVLVSGGRDDLNALYGAFLSVIGDEKEYLYNAAPCQRLLSFSYELRQALAGKASENGNYSFRALWPDTAFVAAVLDNFVMHSVSKGLYVARLTEAVKKESPSVAAEQAALIHYFQELVWNELERVVGKKQLRTIFGQYYDLRSMHFRFPQFDGYYTQWLDLLNIQYLFSLPCRRGECLVSVLTRLFQPDMAYYSLKNNIDDFARRKGVRVTGVSLAGYSLTNAPEW